MAFAQNAGTPASPASPAAPQTTGGQTPAEQSLPPQPTSTEPDYPLPRSFTLGVFGFKPISSDGPDIRNGHAATSIYESVPKLGSYRSSIGLDGSFPITRTTVLAFEFERLRGSANHTLTVGSYLNGNPWAAGETLNISYRITTGRIYIDDLLYPHKFPVAHLRFKSIWGARYIGAESRIDDPAADIASPNATIADTTHHVFYPEFGLGMEYQPDKHVLFRVEGSGFAFPHRSGFGQTSATLSLREGHHLEVIGGLKTFHFKSSPKADEYMIGTAIMPFVELRWHF